MGTQPHRLTAHGELDDGRRLAGRDGRHQRGENARCPPCSEGSMNAQGDCAMTASDQTASFGARLMRNAGAWLIGTALVFIALGIAAIVEPFVAGLAVSLLVGWLLVAAGITHVLSVFRRDDGGTIWHLAVGLFYVCGGWYFLSNPVIALGALTLLLAMMLFVEAGVRLVASSARHEQTGAATQVP